MVAYAVTLTGLVIANFQLFHRKYYEDKLKKEIDIELSQSDDTSCDSDVDADSLLSGIYRKYMVVYILCVAADWLQGSYTYSVYSQVHGLSEATIARLFAIGFASGGVAGIWTGRLADKYGRKKACLTYCLLYSISCLVITVSSDLTVLFIGRVLGGISTTLLYSVFETWLVAELHRHNAYSDFIQDCFASLALTNGAVAIACGVLSEVLVSASRSQKAPFVASILCLLMASVLIAKEWDENFGCRSVGAERTSHDLMGIFRGKSYSLTRRSELTMTDGKVIALGFVTCVMEGSMYAVVFSWTPFIQESREGAYVPERAPRGLIFANLMCAMMLGSQLLARLTKADHAAMTMSHFVQLGLTVAASSLSIAVMTHAEAIRFLTFCLFEVCIGTYYPAMAALKQALISDERRGQVYGLLRLPLNAFVIGILSMIGEGQCLLPSIESPSNIWQARLRGAACLSSAAPRFFSVPS
ncbi:hypothetical protein KVT40_006392 [Elsinoe batatas]|uniref:Molybdate-anion transporter n=1 Tax=Elsinoe batatas TaxID=2601811 RepID=A0A8K0KXK5_9PEZI|nr:hypothetical protein KVT40_006392 [Elsinoe batatas]